MASLDNKMSQVEGKMVAMGTQFENNFATVYSKIEQLETRHDNLNGFVTQMSNTMNDQQAKTSGKMPSNTVINPKSLNAIELRSGKRVQFAEEEGCDDEDESPPVSPMRLSESAKEKALLKKSKEPRGVEKEVDDSHEEQPREKLKNQNKAAARKGEMSKEGALMLSLIHI